MSQIDLAETFRNEVSELLDNLEQSLLDLNSKPGDQELVDSSFRALHTIKGSGAMFGFEQVAGFTHEFESLFDRIRKGEARISEEVIAISLAAKDHIRSLVERPNETEESAGASILARLHHVTGGNAHGKISAARSKAPRRQATPGRDLDRSHALQARYPRQRRQSSAAARRVARAWHVRDRCRHDGSSAAGRARSRAVLHFLDRASDDGGAALRNRIRLCLRRRRYGAFHRTR